MVLLTEHTCLAAPSAGANESLPQHIAAGLVSAPVPLRAPHWAFQALHTLCEL